MLFLHFGLCLSSAAPERSNLDSGYARTATYIMRTAMKLPPHILPTLDEIDGATSDGVEDVRTHARTLARSLAGNSRVHVPNVKGSAHATTLYSMDPNTLDATAAEPHESRLWGARLCIHPYIWGVHLSRTNGSVLSQGRLGKLPGAQLKSTTHGRGRLYQPAVNNIR